MGGGGDWFPAPAALVGSDEPVSPHVKEKMRKKMCLTIIPDSVYRTATQVARGVACGTLRHELQRPTLRVQF